MRTWKDVATLVKPKSLNGRFVARPAADFPFMLEIGAQVAFVPPQTDFPRTATVVFVRDIDGAAYEVGFDAISDEATAHGVSGCHCLVKRDDIDGAVYQEGSPSWVGWRIIERDSVIGDVVALVENPGQSLLEVKRENGKLVYIPVVDEFIRDVDVEEQAIRVVLPVGLLDL